MTDLEIRDLKKSFKNTRVLHGLSLDITSGGFVSLLGPSGCGKTTLLRCIAGLESPSAGQIIIGDDDVTTLPPEQRRLGMMFQSYALFPHMTVLENVRFGLRMLKDRTVDDQRQAAREALARVRMDAFESRMPSELSGGQQQRIALARAIAFSPRILLLDEPLSNLDARLREEMQIELVELHREMGLTTVFVTHDQHEAMAMSDTVVLMRDGEIEQTGTPSELYRTPRTEFSAEFLGSANLIPAYANSGVARLASSDIEVPLADPNASGSGFLVLRQEVLSFGSAKEHKADAVVPAAVRTSVFRGAHSVAHVDAVGHYIKVMRPGSADIPPGGQGFMSWNSRDATWISKGVEDTASLPKSS